MSDRSLLKIGIVGTVVAALCCFTPRLVAALGLSALVGMLNDLLLPALAFFVLITVYALWKRRQSPSD